MFCFFFSRFGGVFRIPSHSSSQSAILLSELRVVSPLIVLSLNTTTRQSADYRDFHKILIDCPINVSEVWRGFSNVLAEPLSESHHTLRVVRPVAHNRVASYKYYRGICRLSITKVRTVW